jgi:endo-1,4-beta-D-glucanase Y
VLAAGPWAVGQRAVNPSYLVVNVMSQLWWTIGAQEWAPVAATSRAMLDELTATDPHLPPDWATVSEDGARVGPASSPSGESPRYGYDGVRVLVQLAVDCDASGQAIAARSWPFLSEHSPDLAAAYSLTGEPVDTAITHPAALAGAAAAAAAAGEEDAAAQMLDTADARDDEHSTYYGAAWVALARIWLDTDLLGGCRPREPLPA